MALHSDFISACAVEAAWATLSSRWWSRARSACGRGRVRSGATVWYRRPANANVESEGTPGPMSSHLLRILMTTRSENFSKWKPYGRHRSSENRSGRVEAVSRRRGARLSEVRENDVVDQLKHIYQDIRVLLQVPMVNLIYRHMASSPGFLEWAWSSVRPIVADGSVASAASRIIDMVEEHPPARISPAALRALHVSEQEHRDVARILAAYNQANPCNLMNVNIVLRLLNESNEDAEEAPRVDLPRPGSVPTALQPEMIDPSDMSETTAALVASLPSEPTIVPSLYRHLANWPELLAAQSVLLEPVRGKMATRVDTMRREASRAADMLLTTPGAVPRYSVPRIADEGVTARTLGSFIPTICTMVIVGKVFERAMPPAP